MIGPSQVLFELLRYSYEAWNSILYEFDLPIFS